MNQLKNIAFGDDDLKIDENKIFKVSEDDEIYGICNEF